MGEQGDKIIPIRVSLMVRVALEVGTWSTKAKVTRR